ncbi:MAG: hypothetical protein ACYTBJ_12065 [Planctomycetota bacterium]|jgi:hypothetical protein
MSTVIILTPILAPVIMGGWPAITAAAAAAAAALGCVVKESVQEAVQQQQSTAVGQSVEVELTEGEVIAENIATGKEIVLTKGNVELRISRDERGHCKVCASGPGHTETELRRIAEEFAQRMTQCFVYNRVTSELKNKGFQVIDEEIMEDESVRIHVRRWVD